MGLSEWEGGCFEKNGDGASLPSITFIWIFRSLTASSATFMRASQNSLSSFQNRHDSILVF